MSERLPSLEQAFEAALTALAPSATSIVTIGGWAVRLLREHELAIPLSQGPLFTTDLDVALSTDSHELGEGLHQRLEHCGFTRVLEGDERPPVSAHVMKTKAGPVKVEFLMTRRGAPTRRDGSSNRTTEVGGLTTQCFPTIRLLLLEPWSVRRAISAPVEGAPSQIGFRVPNPTSLIFEKLIILGDRKTIADRAKDLLYVMELLSAFGDSQDVLAALAREIVRPELTSKEEKRVRSRVESLIASDGIVLAAAAAARATGRPDWGEAATLASALRAGLTPLIDT